MFNICLSLLNSFGASDLYEHFKYWSSRKFKRVTMPRSKRAEVVPGPVAFIDLTQDSPSNNALRLSRSRNNSAQNTIREVQDSSEDEDAVVPLDHDETPLPKKNRKPAIVNLEETINLDDSENSKPLINKPGLLSNPENQKSSLSCPICFESVSDDNIIPMTTPCGHVYCLDCLKKITRDKKRCSLCQRTIAFKNCIRLHI